VPERWTLVSGRVAGISKDGLTITLEQPVRTRGAEPKSVDIKLTAETRIVFSGVGPDKAQLTAGYDAQARLLDGSTDMAAQVVFSPPGVGRRR